MTGTTDTGEPPPPTLGVFDLGGVLYRFSGRLVLERFATGPLDEDVLASWAQVPAVRDFESGRIGVDEFSRGVIDTFHLACDAATFAAAFADAAEGFHDGALDVVAGAGFDAVVTLSNTNSLQWSRVVAHLPNPDPFARHYPSHLTGQLKPARGAYEQLRRDWPDHRLQLYDDRADNVAAARAAGLCAFQVHGVAGIADALRVRGP